MNELTLILKFYSSILLYLIERRFTTDIDFEQTEIRIHQVRLVQ